MDISKHDNSEFSNNVYKNMMDLFYKPEINIRKEKKLINENFTLIAAQVIFFPDGRPHLVRLNEEVAVEVKLKKGVDKNAVNFWPSINEVENVTLYESKFLNCGHATLILFKDGFQLTFDFQYNKQIVNEHLSVAGEFLKTTKYSLENALVFAFIDNAFSAIELLAKANLLIEANKNVYGSTNHKTIKAAFNLRFKDSQSEFELKRRDLFNQLSEARTKARYLEGSFKIHVSALQSIYDTIDTMYLELSKRTT